ncbi:7865_t:CDS:2 [Entrophospora sp. SA101]|nr:7865_t:CDS:2 [Entrophospora sp. SA101]
MNSQPGLIPLFPVFPPRNDNNNNGSGNNNGIINHEQMDELSEEQRRILLSGSRESIEELNKILQNIQYQIYNNVSILAQVANNNSIVPNNNNENDSNSVKDTCDDFIHNIDTNILDTSKDGVQDKKGKGKSVMITTEEEDDDWEK